MRRATKRDSAYRKIKQMFLEQHFLPDSMLSENEIASILGVSRTPVREAFQMLQSEGFVDVFPKRGIMFKGISVSAAREILDLRAAIEGYSAAMCIPLSAENFAELEKMLEIQRQCGEAGDISAYLKHDIVFHSRFIEIHNNSLLSGIARSINERFMSVGLAVLRDIPAISESHRGHVEILKALRANDLERVFRAVHAHIEFGKSQLCQGPAPRNSEMPYPEGEFETSRIFVPPFAKNETGKTPVDPRDNF